MNIVAWASYQHTTDITPFWRVLKSGGELNEKYPKAVKLQKHKLEKGHTVITEGTKHQKYYSQNKARPFVSEGAFLSDIEIK